MEREQRFALKLHHYRDDSGTTDDVHRIQPRGRQVKQIIKHIVGVMSKQKPYLDVRPQDTENLEPELAEAAKAVMEWELYHPTKGYEGPRNLMILQSVCARMGAVEIEYDPEVGMWGEIVFTRRDGRTVMWSEGYDSPHDPRCPWFSVAMRMRVSEIEGMAGWNNTENLRPDAGFLGPGAEASAGLGDREGPSPTTIDVSSDDGFVTVVKMWERGVKGTSTREKEGSLSPLPPSDRYIECATCGYKTGTQEQEERTLPEMEPCKECGAMAERMDAEVLDEKILNYRRGKRFTIFAPYQKREFVHLKGWPYDTTEIPCVVFQFDPYPGDPIGGSVTYDHWTMQVGSNMLTRLALENMKLAKPYVGMPAGAQDYRGRVWEFGPEQGLGIHFPPDTPYQARTLQMIQGNGIPNGWSQLDQSFEAKFKSNTGTADMGLAPNQTRNIPVGTLTQYIEQGDIMTDEAQARLRLAESPPMQALYEIIKRTYTPERWREYQGEDGKWTGMLLSGDNLPSVNIVVTANPSAARVDLEQLQSWERFAAAPAHLREFYAKRLNIPISEVKKLEEAEAMAMQQAAMQQAAMGAMAAPPQAQNGKPQPQQQPAAFRG